MDHPPTVNAATPMRLRLALAGAAAVIVVAGLWTTFGHVPSARSAAGAGGRFVGFCGSSASGRQVAASATVGDGACEAGSK